MRILVHHSASAGCWYLTQERWHWAEATHWTRPALCGRVQEDISVARAQPFMPTAGMAQALGWWDVRVAQLPAS